MNLPTLGPSLRILSIIDVTSPHSTEVAKLLTHITWPAGTRFHLLVIVPERLPCMDSHRNALNHINEALELVRWRDWASAKIIIQELITKLRTQKLKVESEICEKQSVDMALERILKLSVHLIVTTDNWFDSQHDVAMSSIVSKLVDRTPYSHLVVRSSAQIRPLRTILAVGGPFKTQRTIEFLKALSLPEWAKVTVVSVAEEKTSALVGETLTRSYLPTAMRQSEGETVGVCTSKVIEQLHSAGVQARRSIRFGDPVGEVLAVAQEQDADLIVIGACGQISNRLDGLSSIAQKIVRQAPCSVLAIR